eukprot:6179350-Pleurochrysis_carterae.AAC.1
MEVADLLRRSSYGKLAQRKHIPIVVLCPVCPEQHEVSAHGLLVAFRSRQLWPMTASPAETEEFATDRGVRCSHTTAGNQATYTTFDDNKFCMPTQANFIFHQTEASPTSQT